MAILIDAEQLSKHKYVGVEYNGIEMGIPASAVNVLAYKWGWNDALDSVESFAPIVDAEPVVRCKDCKWYEESKNSEIYPMRFCYRLKNDNGVRVGYNCDGNDFCSHGERREDDSK